MRKSRFPDEQMSRFASALLLGILVSASGARFSEASCNSIPDATRISLPGKPPSSPADSNVTLETFGFKGALGRIDRVFLLPAAAGGTSAVTVVADGICVGPKGNPIEVKSPKLDSADDLVALVYFPSRDGARVRPYGSTESCATLTKGADAGRKKSGGVRIMPTCSPVESVKIEKVGDGLRITLPDLGELRREAGVGKISALRVVVARKDRAAALVTSAANQTCAQMCDHAVEGLAVCIDEIFAASTKKNGKPQTYASDPIPCKVQMPSELDAIDFSKACENEDATPPACASAPVTSIAFWQDECGGVHVPFDWRAILPASGKREVRGRSGVGREKTSKNPGVWIPGREFLGSTPIKYPQGAPPKIDWRRPEIDVWPENHDEFGLKGIIDKDDSIVHIFPRLPTKVVCAGTKNACMGIDSSSDPNFVFCACADNGMEPCACEELETPQFFICGDGDKEGMPCTRDRHCPGGRCNGTPHCHAFGSVWTGQRDEHGTPCMTDRNCKTTPPARQQCGYRLFNLEDAIDDPVEFPPAPKWGAIVLDAKLQAGGHHKRRGVCKKNGRPCGNGSGSGAPGACLQDECRGYQMRAGK